MMYTKHAYAVGPGGINILQEEVISHYDHKKDWYIHFK